MLPRLDRGLRRSYDALLLQQDQCRQTEETQEADHIGHRGQHHATGQRGIDVHPLQSQRHQHAGQRRGDKLGLVIAIAAPITSPSL